MKKIDCLGDICPVPLMKLQSLEATLKGGDGVMIVTDHSCTCQSLIAYCRKKRYPLRIVEPMSGIWEVSIFPEENEDR